MDPYRFWSKVNIGAPDECWPWKAERNKRRGGYGIFRAEGRKRIGAHRVALELATGQSPGELNVLHSCDNPPCCNPAHLRAGTQADNNRDKIERNRDNPRRKVNDEQVISIRKLYVDGRTMPEIAQMFGISVSQAHRLATGKSQVRVDGENALPEWKIRGLHSSKAKVTDEQVRAIRELSASGRYTQAKIGEMFGISQSHVCKIIKLQDRKNA